MLLDRIDALTGRVTDWLVRVGAVVLAVMVLMTFFDVMGRYLISQPIVGTVDMTELFMGLIIYLGVGATTHRGDHISVDIVVSHLAPALRMMTDLLSDVISAVLAVLICWQLWIVAVDTQVNTIVTRVWETPVYPVAYVMAAASIFMALAFVLHVLKGLRRVLALLTS